MPPARNMCRKERATADKQVANRTTPLLVVYLSGSRGSTTPRDAIRQILNLCCLFSSPKHINNEYKPTFYSD